MIKHGLAKDRDRNEKPIKPRDYFSKGLCITPIIDHAGKVISFKSKDPTKKQPGVPLKGRKKWFLNYQALGRGSEIFVVEGENDVAALMDAGVDNVVGTAGGPGKDQGVLLKNHYAGKRVYLWFDRDPDKDPRKNDGGPKHTRFIYEGLAESGVEVKVIAHPGEEKDPDDYLRAYRGTEGRQAVKKVKEAALDPIEWEVDELKRIGDPKDRLLTLKKRELPLAINRMQGHAEKELLVDRMATAVGISVKAIEDLLENSVDLYEEMSQRYNGAAGIKRVDPRELAVHIFKWFTNGAGARFFKTADDKVWIFYHGQRYEISPQSIAFNTLMDRMTRLSAMKEPGNSVWYYLKTLCYAQGEPIDEVSWLYTDRAKDTIFLNLNSPHNKIIKLVPGDEPELIDNGTNEHSVLLSTSPQIKTFQYQPDASEAEGFRALKRLLMDTTPAEGAQRYFLICWMITTFLLDFQGDRGLMQVIGSSGLGKSKVAERVSQLLYGANYVGRGSGAADVRIATHNPVTFLDNIENRDLSKGKIDFMLLLATSSVKPKAKAGSDTEVLYQKLNSMGMCTAIEPFPGKFPELINRTFPLILEKRFKLSGYMHDQVMGDIRKERDLILSAILKMVGHSVLPKLTERRDWSTRIHTDFPGHNKERMNEHLCTMMLILEGLLEYLPYKQDEPLKKQAAEILTEWIRYQEEQAQDTPMISNNLLGLMNGIAKEVLTAIRKKNAELPNGIPYEEAFFRKRRIFGFMDGSNEPVKAQIYEDPEYLQEFYFSEEITVISDDPMKLTETHRCLDLIVQASELDGIFHKHSKRLGKRSPYETPAALAGRIRDDKELMARAGWTYKDKTGGKGGDRIKAHGMTYWWFSLKVD